MDELASRRLWKHGETVQITIRRIPGRTGWDIEYLTWWKPSELADVLSTMASYYRDGLGQRDGMLPEPEGGTGDE